jgi:HAD superfamily phosphatase
MTRMLVFDMDGVLVDVSGSYRETIRATVQHFTGREITRELIQDYKNAGGWNNDWALSQKIIADLGREVDYPAVVDYFQRVFFGEDGRDGFILRERWLPSNGMLHRLAAQYRLGIFTGRLRAEADVTLQRFVPDLRWDMIVADDDVTKSKPAPDGLLMIAAKFPGEEILYLGDTVDDARSSRAAGVPFVGIAGADNPKQSELRELLKAEGAIAVIENINQLEDVLCGQPR